MESRMMGNYHVRFGKECNDSKYLDIWALHLVHPFIELGQFSTVIYFAYFLILVPLVSLFENSLIEISNQYKSMVFKDLENIEINSSNILRVETDLTILPFVFLLPLLSIYRNNNEISLLEHCDAPRPWGIYFQDSATPQMEGLVELHDNILFYLVIILFGVGWMLLSIIKNYTNTESPISHKYLNHGTLIELIWTITPALILMLIAFPSFKLLYLMDEVSDPAMSVLAEGHQWYWSYQYPDFLNSENEFIEFDSYLVPESDLEDGALRMLEVDNRVIIPELTHVRFIVTGADVIHSFACPALGIKCDA